MCRNIKTLYNYNPVVTEDEIRAAALQYVRKVSGFAHPSKANRAAFQAAVDAVTAASTPLLNSPRDKRAAQKPRWKKLPGPRRAPFNVFELGG